MRHVIIATTIAVAIATSAAAEKSYEKSYEDGNFLCVAEMATGFKVTGGKWTSADFIADDKYLVRPLRKGDHHFDNTSDVPQYAVFDFGEEKSYFVSDSGFTYERGSKIYHDTYMTAEHPVGKLFVMNKKTMRYTLSYLPGWVGQSAHKEQKNGNTPLIELGSCSRIYAN